MFIINPFLSCLMIEIQSCYVMISPFLPWTFPRSNIYNCQREASKISYVTESFNSATFNWSNTTFSMFYLRICANKIFSLVLHFLLVFVVNLWAGLSSAQPSNFYSSVKVVFMLLTSSICPQIDLIFFGNSAQQVNSLIFYFYIIDVSVAFMSIFC